MHPDLHTHSLLLPVRASGMVGYADRSGNLVLEAKFQHGSDFSEGLASVKMDNRAFFVAENGDTMALKSARTVDKLREGKAGFLDVQGKCGYVDASGAIVVKAMFDSVGVYSEGFAVVYRGQKYRVLDGTGKFTAKTRYDFCGYFSEGIAAAKEQRSGNYGYIRPDCSWAVRPKFDEAYPFSNGLALVREGGRLGYINHDGDFVIPPKYLRANNFGEGLAPVLESKAWGYIDTRGEMVIGPQFQKADVFSEGLAPIYVGGESDLAGYMSGGKCGYIGKDGRMLIQPEFDDAFNFHSGCARVQIGDASKEEESVGYIDYLGKYIWRPSR